MQCIEIPSQQDTFSILFLLLLFLFQNTTAASKTQKSSIDATNMEFILPFSFIFLDLSMNIETD